MYFLIIYYIFTCILDKIQYVDNVSISYNTCDQHYATQNYSVHIIFKTFYIKNKSTRNELKLQYKDGTFIYFDHVDNKD